MFFNLIFLPVYLSEWFNNSSCAVFFYSKQNCWEIFDPFLMHTSYNIISSKCLTTFVSYQIYPSVMKNLISICSVRLLRSCCRFHVTYNQHALSHRLTFSLWSSLLFPSLVPSPMPILYLPQSCVLITGAWLQLFCSVLYWIVLSYVINAYIRISSYVYSFKFCSDACVYMQVKREHLHQYRNCSLPFVHRKMWNVNLHSIELCLTGFLCRQCTCEMVWDFCLALEWGFSREVLKRRIDLFTSPSNTELVQLELKLMGVNCNKLKITNQLRLTLYGWLDDFSQQPFYVK